MKTRTFMFEDVTRKEVEKAVLAFLNEGKYNNTNYGLWQNGMINFFTDEEQA